MQTVSVNEAASHLAALIEQAQREPVAIEQGGKTAAIMISPERFALQQRQGKGAALAALCDMLAETAARNGMTEEVLTSILNQPRA